MLLSDKRFGLERTSHHGEEWIDWMIEELTNWFVGTKLLSESEKYRLRERSVLRLVPKELISFIAKHSPARASNRNHVSFCDGTQAEIVRIPVSAFCGYFITQTDQLKILKARYKPFASSTLIAPEAHPIPLPSAPSPSPRRHTHTPPRVKSK